MQWPPSVRQGFFSFAPKSWPLVRATDIRLLLKAAERANHVASHGLIWPKNRCASIALAATASDATFFPWACHPALRARGDPGSPIPRGRQESLTAAILRCATARRRVRRRSPSACRSPSRPRRSRARATRRN